MLTTNHETVRNEKQAKDLVAAYLMEKAINKEDTDYNVSMTNSKCRHDIETHKQDKLLISEIKCRTDNVTKYNDYKIETDKINYLKTHRNASVIVGDVVGGKIYYTRVKTFLDAKTSTIVHNDKFPIDNDDNRYTYKYVDGTHVNWCYFKTIEYNMSSYHQLLDIAKENYGKTTDEIILLFDRLGC